MLVLSLRLAISVVEPVLAQQGWNRDSFGSFLPILALVFLALDVSPNYYAVYGVSLSVQVGNERVSRVVVEEYGS